MDSLRERALAYETVNDLKLTRRLPVAIVLNGRRFRKTTSLLEKPHSDMYIEIMGQVMIRLASEIDGVQIVYSFNDEIVIICRNDQSLETEAWYDNNLQKMVSAAASLASIAFFKAAQNMTVSLVGEPVFTGKAFVLPNVTETVNYLISKQNQASHDAVSLACHYELLSKYDVTYSEEKLKYKNSDEKFDILTRECRVDPTQYPLAFWRGVACYRSTRTIKNAYGKEESKKKLSVDPELPVFSKDQDFLFKIFND